MSRPLSQILRAPIFYALLVLAAMLVLSFSLRKNDFIENNGSQNIEATYHVLLTVKAMDENPASQHLFLPTVTLGGVQDKATPWGATIPTATGDYIYTSFGFPGFVAPYIWLKTFNAEKTTTNLAYFSVFLGSLTATLLLFFCYALARSAEFSRTISATASLLACTIAIFSREALLSTGLTYWAQCLYQVILALSLIVTLKYLNSQSNRRKSIYAAVIIALVFTGALTEWTGYIFNAGLVLLFWFGVSGAHKDRRMSAYIFGATALAGIVTISHLSAAVGFYPAVDSLAHRFIDRSASTGSIAMLISGYGLSYGLFFLIAGGIVAISSLTKDGPDNTNKHSAIAFLFIASCIPLIENLLMLQHASAYTFDRLKFIFPAAIILLFFFAKSKILGRVVLPIALVAASYQGYGAYRDDLKQYSMWQAVDAYNKTLASKVKTISDQSCTVYVSSFSVRGYANLLFNHGIHEYKKPEDAENIFKGRNGCALVYLEGDLVLPDLPKYTKATIRQMDGSIDVIEN